MDHVRHEMRARGVALPFVFTPHPVVGISAEVLYGYLEGPDPDTGKRVIDEIIVALTVEASTGSAGEPAAAGVAAPEGGGAGPESPQSEATVGPATDDELQRIFYERGWTDGLPIILPTEERVGRMLAGTSHSPDEVVGEVFVVDTGEHVTYTVANVAVAAVMAGARPEHLPVILAVASTGYSAFMPSTTPFAFMLMVNGPIRNEIGMNTGMAAFSPLNLANSVIGRAWTLMSINWGFARRGKTLWSTQGNPLIYTSMCVGENEERSVWAPFHVRKGFEAGESVVSIFRGWNVLNAAGAAAHRSITEEIDLQLGVLPGLFSNATIIMDPLVARQLKENEGFATSEDYSRWLSTHVKIPARRYWGTDYVDMLVASPAEQGVEPYASWRRLRDDELIAHYHDPDRINLVVVGGETSPLWKTTDYGHLASVSIDRWRLGAPPACSDGTCGLPDPPANYDD
jgi:hypothetical protein